MGDLFTPEIGIFAAILDHEGKILLRKRVLSEEKKSSVSGKNVKNEWELPGGGVEDLEMLNAGDERGLLESLQREVGEEMNMCIVDIALPLQTFPVVIAKEISPGKIARDIALLVIVKPNNWGVYQGGIRGETAWVDVKQLNKLAKGSAKGKLVSGFGKRMHRMALMALLHSANRDCRLEAKATLKRIYSN